MNKLKSIRGCLVLKKPSLITPHSIFVTHHSSLKIPQFPIPHTFGTHHSVMFSTKKLKKIGINTLTQCPRTFLFSFFSFSLDSHLSLPLPFVFSLLFSSFFPCYSLKPLHEPNNRNQGLDLRRQSPSSPSVAYLVGIITQHRKISSNVPQWRRSVIMVDLSLISFFFFSVVICMNFGFWFSLSLVYGF